MTISSFRRGRLYGAILIGLLLRAIGAGAQVNEHTPGFFPFVIPQLDATPSFTDMSFLSPEPAGAAGRVTIRDGHFYDGHGKRLRLIGTNMTFFGAFPDKKYAGRIAAHLRKLGINVVRFHHMDMRPAPRGIWLPDFSGFDARQVDKLDFFIYRLKQCGIYVDLNLHVSRTYPGVPPNLGRPFRFGKALDNFYPPFIRLQKQYAKMLLAHRNPYTGTTYAQEPAVIVVELNNENSLTNAPLARLLAVPGPCHAELTRQWRAWLAKKYASTEAIRKKWDEGDRPLGREILVNGSFSGGMKGWRPQQGDGAKMQAQVVDAPDAPGGHALAVTTLASGSKHWDLQVHQVGLDLKAGQVYTLRFQAKADALRTLAATVMLDRRPYTVCGLSVVVDLTPSWKAFSYSFKCVNPVPRHCRISFSFNNQTGTFALADVSLRPGGSVGLPKGQSLEAGTIALPSGNAASPERIDFVQFLSDTECRYVREMRAYLRHALGVEAQICDTQVSYGGILGMVREGRLSDYIDMHAYFAHQQFPVRPWDPKNWFVPNISLAADPDGGRFPYLAWHRMAGKPFTVSEYNQPAPNDHRAEMFPMLASFAAFQDWDGFYEFDWNSWKPHYDKPKICGYLELCADPAKLAFLPIAALMFREAAVAPGRQPVVATLHTGDAAAQWVEKGKAFGPVESLTRVPLVHRVAFRLADGNGGVQVPDVHIPPGATRSDTGQIFWDATDPKRAIYTVNAPAVRAAVGFVGGRRIRLGNVTIRVTKARENWASVAVGALDGKPISQSGRILVVLVGDVENSNMGWNKDRTSVSNKWGSAPTVAEGIVATITVPGAARVQALDGTGKPVAEVATKTTDAGTQFETGPQYRTLWYAVTR